jgi:hypothetical protein
MSAPNYLTFTILLSSIGIIAAALAGLRVAVTRAGWEEARRIGLSRRRRSRADHRVRHLRAGRHRPGVAVAI